MAKCNAISDEYNATDILIRNKINEKIEINENYFTYIDVTKKAGIHSFARYPATMVPEMQNDILDIVIDSIEVKDVLDPFMGSGTVLVESMKKGLNIHGIDLNPYAYYLSYVKTNYVDAKKLKVTFYNLKNRIEKMILEDTVKNHTFNKIDKWFRNDIQKDLSILRSAILKIRDKDLMLFFLITFADMATETKNSQSSTFKLHAKKEEDILSYRINTFSSYYKKVNRNIMNYSAYYKSIADIHQGIKKNITCGDSRDILNQLDLEQESIDLVVTSPPYGDNHTTVTYGQYSSLPMYWINNGKLAEDFDENLLNNFSSVDRASLGGSNYTINQILESGILKRSETLNSFYELMLNYDRTDKARKVASFIIDFAKVTESMHFVLKKDKYFVLVVGNRRVHNHEVAFDKIICELLERQFYLISDFKRQIKNKKMARKISKVEKKAVKSMETETILIFRKI